jgi:hypothetical protein
MTFLRAVRFIAKWAVFFKGKLGVTTKYLYAFGPVKPRLRDRNSMVHLLLNILSLWIIGKSWGD